MHCSITVKETKKNKIERILGLKCNIIIISNIQSVVISVAKLSLFFERKLEAKLFPQKRENFLRATIRKWVHFSLGTGIVTFFYF